MPSSISEVDRVLDAESTIVDILTRHAVLQGDRTAFVYWGDGDRETGRLSYAALDRAARRVGAAIQARGLVGERLLLLEPPGLDFVVTFFGCLYGGALPVPAYPPATPRHMPRLYALSEDARPRLALTSAALVAVARAHMHELPRLAHLEWLQSTELSGDAERWRRVSEAETPAFIQYTSGSTQAPRGIVVTHANLVHNERSIRDAFAATSRDVYVSWLPLFHDMGLIGQMIQSACVGAECHLMPPTAFLERPLRWLSAISRCHGTISGSPNFAYDLCARKISDAERATLNLSSWRVAFNGAEPVRAATLTRFAERFAPCGFRREAAYPCYGLAEATLIVSGGRVLEAPVTLAIDRDMLERGEAQLCADDARANTLVSSGFATGGQSLCVVDPETGAELLEGRVGELWVSGPSVAAGYWGAPEATRAHFHNRVAGRAGDYLRTGDLAFLRDGRVFITGRLRDLIIVRGRNIYPQDVELAAEQSASALRPGCSAAFSVDGADGEELVLVAEARPDAVSPAEVTRQVREAVQRALEVSVARVVLVPPGAIPKTSSGKIQRRACRAALIAGKLATMSVAEFARDDSPSASGAALVPAAPQASLASAAGPSIAAPVVEPAARRSLLALPAERRAAAVQYLLQDQLARRWSVSPLDLLGDPPLSAVGVDSLRAAELAGWIEEHIGARVGLADLLASASLSAAAQVVALRLAAPVEVGPLAWTLAATDATTPLAFQRRVWLEAQLADGAPVFNMVGRVVLDGALSLGRWVDAIGGSAMRHDALRARLVAHDGEPRLEFGATGPTIHVVDVSNLAPSDAEQVCARLLAETTDRPLPLGDGAAPCWRAHVVRRAQAQHELWLAVHHGVADGWSMGVLLGEWRRAASGRSLEAAVSLAELVARERARAGSPRAAAELAYWVERLSGVDPELSLPYDTAPRGAWSRAGQRALSLPPGTAARVRAVAARHGATPFGVLLTAYVAMLHRVGRARDIVVGVPVGLRGTAGERRAVAPLVNTVAVRIVVDPAEGLDALLARVQSTVYEALEHHEAPVDEVVRALGLPRRGATNPLFQVMFALESYPLDADVDDGLRCRSTVIADGGTTGALTVSFREEAGELAGRLSYDTTAFAPDTVERFERLYGRILDGLLLPSPPPLARVGVGVEPGRVPAILTGAEGVVGAETVLDLLRATAARHGQRMALEEGARRIDHVELWALGGAGARALASLGVVEGSVVACVGARGWESAVAALAVWRAGAVYLPIDPRWPASRSLRVVREAGARVALLAGGRPRWIDEAALRVCAVSDVVSPSTDDPSEPVRARPEGAAYVLYTSGSTGTPRGVVVTHAALAVTIRGLIETYALSPDDRALQLASPAFDVALEELWPTLVAGGAAVFDTDERAAALELDALVAEARLTVLNLPAQTWERWIGDDVDPRRWRTLRLVVVGSEAVSTRSLERWWKVAPEHIGWCNAYGVTEATITSTVFRPRAGSRLAGRAVPIGAPLRAVAVAVVDDALEPVEMSAPGELLVAGAAVALGYLDRPGSTARAFTAVDRALGARGYRTGDRGRVGADGALTFAGRGDRQVKIRGQRVELAEVEAALTEVVGADVVVVVVTEVGDGVELCGFHVDGDAVTLSALAARVPSAFVPRALVRLMALPLLPNGKVDHGRLVELGRAASEAGQGVSPAERPGDALEVTIADVWAQVLGHRRFDRNSRFFEVGGHSLAVAQVVGRLRRVLARPLPIAWAFEAPTVAGLAERVRGAPISAERVASPSATSEPRATPAERRLYFAQRLDSGGAGYNVPIGFDAPHGLHAAAAGAAADQLVHRHPAFRTRYRLHSGVVLRDATPARGAPGVVVDLDGLDAAERTRWWAWCEQLVAQRPFDVERDLLLDWALVVAGGAARWWVRTHHIAVDGRGVELVIGELARDYVSSRDGSPSSVSAPSARYDEYALHAANQSHEEALAYWRTHLADLPPNHELPYDRAPGRVASAGARMARHAASERARRGVAALAMARGATPFMVVLAAYFEAMRRLVGGEDQWAGMVLSERDDPRWADVVGCYVNTAVLRVDLRRTRSFADVVDAVRDAALLAYAHGHAPFDEVVQAVAPARARGQSPLFQVLLVHQATSASTGGPVSAWGATHVGLCAPAERARKLEWVLEVDPERGVLELEYATELFDHTTAARALALIGEVLEGGVAQPDQPLWTLPSLSTAAYAQLAREWDGRPGPRVSRTVVEDAESTAERMSDRVALVDAASGRTLDYAAWEMATARVASVLVDAGVGPGVAVGVLMERSVELVLAVGGVARAGAVLVPLDVRAPAGRLARMARDAGVAVVLCDAASRTSAEALAPVVELWRDIPAQPATGWRARRGALSPDHPAYLLYTSGSTGQPKGALNGAGALWRRLAWMHQTFGLTADDVVLLKTPFTFDVALWELFLPFMVGARLVVAHPDGHHDPRYLAATCRSHDVTAVHFVPSMLREYVQQPGDARVPTLRYVFASGEALPTDVAQRTVRELGVRLENLYGPTEAAIDVTWDSFRDGDSRTTIGRPIDGVAVQIVGSDGTLSPPTAAGELWISGGAPALGYVGRAAETALRFVPTPVGPAGRSYRTGDRARRLADGRIDYLGRLDRQVKLRGQRLELGEIEAAIHDCAGVREAAVAVVDADGPAARLVAYLVVDGAVDDDVLREKLGQRLQAYMVPRQYVRIPALPRTSSGKLDRGALPRPEAAPAVALSPPEGALEAAVVSAWREVLGAVEVGRDTRFFDVGGQSLLAIGVAQRLEQSLGRRVELAWLFEAQTPRALAARLEASGVTAGVTPEPSTRVARGPSSLLATGASIPSATVEGPPPLTLAQERLLFLEDLLPGTATYVMSGGLELRGAVDVSRVERALQWLVARHPALCTRFARGADGWHLAAPAAPRPLDVVPASHAEALREAERRAARPFELDGPLFRTALFHDRTGWALLTIDLHHAIADGWSVGVLLEGFCAAYDADGELAAPSAPWQYADYARAERRWLDAGGATADLAYWSARLGGVIPTLALPVDRPHPPARTGRGASVSAHWAPGLRVALEAMAAREGVTPFMVLLTALDVLLHRLTGANDVWVGAPVANRDGSAWDRVVGLFVNTVVQRVEIRAGDRVVDVLARVRAAASEAYQHQEAPFELVVRALAPERDLAVTPLFQVMLAEEGLGRAPRLAGLGAERWAAPSTSARADLTFLVDTREGILELEFNSDVFEASTARRLLSSYLRVLETVVHTPRCELRRVSVDDAENSRWLAARARPRPAARPPIDVIAAFAAARVEHRTRVAICDEDGEWTYDMLGARVDQLAAGLHALGVGPEVVVGVALPRSREVLAVQLAVLTVGGAFVSVDPRGPQARAREVLEDSGAAMVVVADEVSALGTPAVTVARLLNDAARVRLSEVRAAARSDALAYVIFTSGSTGRPKGAALRRGGLGVLLAWAVETFGDALLDVLAGTSFSFDLSIFELFAPLVVGGRVRLVASLLDPRAAEASERATLINTVPSVAREAHANGRLDVRGKVVALAGEALGAELVSALFAAGAREIHNLYGPTEDTTYSTGAVVARGCTPDIGLPIDETAAWVMDGDQSPSPRGAAGELWLGGAGLARGYLDRPSLSGHRFVPAPGAHGTRAYRTGDAVRWGASGALEFRGRLDRQIKLRGFRIEPTELESILEGHPAVETAAVQVVNGPSGPVLAAWVVSCGGQGLDESTLRAHLAGRVAQHVIPSAFVVLPAMPRLPSGKIDRRALPAPTWSGGGTDQQGLRTDTERALAALWRGLLGLDELDRNANFFAVGGHSFAAARLAARATAELGVTLSLRDVYASATLAELASRVDVARARGESSRPWVELEVPVEVGVMSPAEERVWFLQRFDERSPGYNLAGALRVEGALDVDALGQAVVMLAGRHEALGTVFADEGGVPRARVVCARPEVRVVDMQLGARGSLSVETWLAAEASRPFVLASGPLLRATVLRDGELRAYVLLSVHHIVADGHSLELMLRELEELYASVRAGRPASLSRPRLGARAWAARQRRWLAGPEGAARRSYWARALAPPVPTLRLPTDRAHPPARTGAGGRVESAISEPLRARVERLAGALEVSPFSVYAAAWAALIGRVADVRRVRVGTVLGQRAHVWLEELVALSIETTVLTLDVPEDGTFSVLAREVYRSLMDAEANQLPFDEVVAQTETTRDLASTPLFQVAVIHQDAPPRAPTLGAASVRRVDVAVDTAKFDLTLIVEAGRWVAELEYNADVFEPHTAARLLDAWSTLLTAAVERPEGALSGLDHVSSTAMRQLAQLGAGPQEHVVHSSAIAPFLAMAEARPGALAVSDGRQRLDYGELEARTARVARGLRRLGVDVGTPVGLSVGRTVDMVVATLGVVRAGGVYVAMDPAYPAERRRFMREDAGAHVVVADADACVEGVGPRPCTLAELEALGRDDLSLPMPGSDELIYVTYTSGSSGRPKGVAVRHRGVLSLIDWGRDTYDEASMARVLCSTSLCFDLSVFEIFVTLAMGGAVVVVDNALAIRSLPREERESLTLINTVPSSGRELVVQGLVPASVKIANFCGEPLPRGLCEQLYQTGVREVWNLYGPSEDTTYSTAHLVVAGEAGPPPIGRTIRGSWAVLEDPEGRARLQGQIGALRLGGAGLARGYLDRPALTARRFGAAPRDRTYETGDLARWRSDDVLEFFGRADYQVKVRGFRVELGELEVLLEQHPAVHQAVVVPDGRESVERLWAFTVPRGGGAPEAELRDFVAARVPHYMVPDRVIEVAEPPRLPNGKIDRQRLPRPERRERTPSEAPSDAALELSLAALWSEALGLERVGVDEDFFALGGQSLIATRLVAQIVQTLGVRLSLRALFELRTPRAVAQHLRGQAVHAEGLVDAPGGPRGERPPLSSAQQRLWLLHQLDRHRPPTALASRIALDGALSAGAVLDVVQELVRRHEALRTSFVGDEVPWQRVEARREVPSVVVDLEGLESDARATTVERTLAAEAVRAVDVERDALMRVAVLRTGAREHTLWAWMHHLITDEWSVRVLMRELSDVYREARAGRPSPLGEPTLHIADHAVRQRRRAGAAELDAARAYWAERLTGAVGVTLAVERPSRRDGALRGGVAGFMWPAELVDGVRRWAAQRGATPFQVLLAALLITLRRYGASADLVVGVPVAERRHPALTGVVGFMVNELPLRFVTDDRSTGVALVQHVREVVGAAMVHHELPYEELLSIARRVAPGGDVPLIGVHFDLHDAADELSRLGEAVATPIDVAPEAPQFPLQLSLTRHAGGYRGMVGFDPRVYSASLVEALVGDFRAAVTELVAEPELRGDARLADGRWRQHVVSMFTEEFTF